MSVARVAPRDEKPGQKIWPNECSRCPRSFSAPLAMPLPLPGNGVAPLNVVPVDFVVQAVWHLSRDPRAVGLTFHLVDPNPMSARRVYEIIAEFEAVLAKHAGPETDKRSLATAEALAVHPKVKRLYYPTLFDEPEQMRKAGFEYSSVGRSAG